MSSVSCLLWFKLEFEMKLTILLLLDGVEGSYVESECVRPNGNNNMVHVIR